MSTALDNDQLEFDLGEGEKATTVALESSEETKETPVLEEAKPEVKVQQEEHADELNTVNEAVQKRIAKLTAKMREAERREQAALEYAKGIQNQANDLQQRLVNTDYHRLSEAKVRLETQQTQLRQIIQKAREEGDITTEIEAQERLTGLLHEKGQVSQWLQQQDNARKSPQEQPAIPQPTAQPPAAQQAQAKPDPRAEEWASRNEWFGQNRVMTYAAWGIHQDLIENEGVDPASDEYYTELDRRIREQFPKNFAGDNISPQNTRQQRSAPAVAPASRSSGINSARRTVRLSPSQVAIAKKLGVPLEEYAKYVKE
jgi:hypothetical protein